jgi:protein-S-isoprenylcysteine O-methyltransferase Ste14
MSFILQHTRLGFCWLDLLALIVLLVVIAVFVIKRHNMKKEEKELEEQLSAFYADETVELQEE